MARYRVYSGKDGDRLVILLGGGTKHHQAKDIGARLRAGRSTNGGDREETLALNRDFKETIRAHVERDPKFRKELLSAGIECMLTGDVATAKTILRNYSNATVGFTELSEATHIPSKSLMRMLGPTGNPRADNLFQVDRFPQNRERVRFRVLTEPRSARAKQSGRAHPCKLAHWPLGLRSPGYHR